MTGAPHSSVARYRELARHPHTRDTHRELLLDGVHLLNEARQSGVTVESAAFTPAALEDPFVQQLAHELAAAGTTLYTVSQRTLERMSPVKTPSGAVGIAHRSMAALDALLERQPSLLVVAHELQDPGNLGGIIRTAEAAGATGVVVTDGAADPFGWKVLRGSMGSALRVPVARASVEDLLPALQSRGVRAAALDPHGGTSIFRAELTGPIAFVVGREGAGLPRSAIDQMDLRLSIPMCPPVESLNAGVAAAIVLYEVLRQRTP